jgi:hypothetical protein
MTGKGMESGPGSTAQAERHPKVGMTSHRTTWLLLTLSLTLTAALLPSNALAGSLLSGYGGPGGGAQAILGSSLVNGGSGSSGSGGGGSAASGGEGGQGSAAGARSTGPSSAIDTGGSAGAAGAPGTRAAAGSTGGTGTRTSGSTGRSGGAGASVGGPAAYTPSRESSSYPAAGLPGAADYGALGFSGADELLMLLVLAALVITAIFTRRLTRMPYH